jgi:hypothetical protein
MERAMLFFAQQKPEMARGMAISMLGGPVRRRRGRNRTGFLFDFGK